MNETDFESTADYQSRDADQATISSMNENDNEPLDSEKMPKVTADSRTGWEGWEEEQWTDPPQKAELDKVKVSESSISNLPRHRYLSGDQTTDTEAGYETAREGLETATETETDAFFSTDEEPATSETVLVPGQDDDATPRASPVPTKHIHEEVLPHDASESSQETEEPQTEPELVDSVEFVPEQVDASAESQAEGQEPQVDKQTECTEESQVETRIDEVSESPEPSQYRDGVTVVERVNNPTTVKVFDPKGN